MDVLSDVLKIVRLTGSIFFTANLYENWSIKSPGPEVLLKNMPCKAECVSLFHIITEGRCWFKLRNQAPFMLEKGHVIVFPHGASHVMGSSMELQPQPLFNLLSFEEISKQASVSYGGEGDRTQLVCGYLLCDQRFNPMLGAIPEVIILSESVNKPSVLPERQIVEIVPDSWLDYTKQHLVKEVTNRQLGSNTIITRLIELMYVEVIRRYMNTLPVSSKGWLAGIRDPQVGRALKLLHNQPQEHWKVNEIAQMVGASRSSFAQRFTAIIGVSPIEYLSIWRMQLAKDMLIKAELSIKQIAEKVGYKSDIAFNRAFKRCVGLPPASWRKSGLRK